MAQPRFSFTFCDGVSDALVPTTRVRRCHVLGEEGHTCNLANPNWVLLTLELCTVEMLRALRRATPTTCCDAQRRRAFFNLTKTNPSHESETQNYHERKILPCVTVHEHTSYSPTQVHADTGAVNCTKPLRT